jgi:uncharacterized protein YbjT (DUF2867 family)/ligand-binding SRPBCC domain-containing protein
MKPDVLLTGATGYIGGRLLRHFEEAGRAVRCVARQPEKITPGRSTTEVVQGDCLDAASLVRAFAGVQSAYYLVHSMAAGPQFAELDRRAAGNFGHAAARAGVRRIIYLGGLADDIGGSSAHLKSRAETGEALRAGGVPVIEFRASIVIGAGSLSFEMIRALVERLPVMVCPRWVETLTQPIAIDDVVAYLAAALDLPESRGQVFEIGGPEVLSYADIMREYARLRRLRRLLLPVPVLTPHLSGLWLALVTPAQAQVGRALVEGLRNATVVRSPAARETFPIHPMPLRTAFQKAIDDGGSAWKVDAREVVVDVSPSQAFAPVRRIGGASGWYFGNHVWKIRGSLDRLFGGASMNRGRRDPDCCIVGDVIDGWTVVAYEPDRVMRLAADMKLPGRGWLEFEVIPVDGGRRSRIRQTATFDPRGLFGRLYWNAIIPIHALMFGGLLRQIARRAERGDHSPDVDVVVHRSVIPASADDVFQWHERPEALLDLIPSGGWVRIERRAGGIQDGGRVVFSIGLGPLRMPWESRHYGYVRGKQFCDEQVKGPFRTWRHTHRMEAMGASQSIYEDRIEYALRGGSLVRRLSDGIVRHFLTSMLMRRHQLVYASFSGPRPLSL